MRCFFFFLFFLPCQRHPSSDKPPRRKEGHGTLHISSVAQPPRGRVANQLIIINTGIHVGIWEGKLFSSCTHTSARLTETMSSRNPPVCSDQLLFTVQQYGSK